MQGSSECVAQKKVPHKYEWIWDFLAWLQIWQNTILTQSRANTQGYLALCTWARKCTHIYALRHTHTHSLSFIGNKSGWPLTFTIQPVWKKNTKPGIDQHCSHPDPANKPNPPPPPTSPIIHPPFFFFSLTLDSPPSLPPAQHLTLLRHHTVDPTAVTLWTYHSVKVLLCDHTRSCRLP